jgi:polysaccharide biosynthesis protein PslG
LIPFLTKLNCALGLGRRLRKAPTVFPMLCLLLLGAGAVALLPSGAAATPHHKHSAHRNRLPANFFGISPNEGLPTPAEFARMHRGGIRTYRVPLGWSRAWPEPGSFNWRSFDNQVAGAAAAGLNVLPIVYSTPRWLGVSPLTLPVGSLIMRDVWQVFLMRAVQRYGPRGNFWRAHPHLPFKPIRAWQIWNEENATFFTEPISVPDYAQLLKISSTALKAADPHATVVVGGLYGRPEAIGGAISASSFLASLYRVKGIKSAFDVVGLHPYSGDVQNMRSQILEIRSIMKREGDARTPLWVDEFGWGSGYDRLSFDKGPEGQKAILVAALKMLINNRRRWNIGREYWFSWEDVPPPACYYCSTSGLFTADHSPKPAWYGYVGVARGRP